MHNKNNKIMEKRKQTKNTKKIKTKNSNKKKNLNVNNNKKNEKSNKKSVKKINENKYKKIVLTGGNINDNQQKGGLTTIGKSNKLNRLEFKNQIHDNFTEPNIVENTTVEQKSETFKMKIESLRDDIEKELFENAEENSIIILSNELFDSKVKDKMITFYDNELNSMEDKKFKDYMEEYKKHLVN